MTVGAGPTSPGIPSGGVFGYPASLDPRYNPSTHALAASGDTASLTVSPTGLSTGASTRNNGADFGPDTPGTTTSGIQEAFNSLPTVAVFDGGGHQVVGQVGSVRLLAGVFGPITSLVRIPPGVIRFRGAGASTWQYVTTMASPTADLGGSAVVGAASLAATGVVACPPDGFGYPLTQLDMGDFDIRITSPAAPQTSAAPDVLDLSGWMMGRVDNMTVAEIAPGGGVGNQMYIITDCDAGAATDRTYMLNLSSVGGHTGIRFNKAHIYAVNVLGGFTHPTIDNFDHGIEIGANVDNFFADLHPFSCTYGLDVYPYTFSDPPFNPLIIHGCHFEAVGNLFIPAAVVTGTVIIEGPVWDTPNLGGAAQTPAQNVAATLAAAGCTYSLAARSGIAVLTRQEVDIHNFGAGRHVTVAPAALVAGASPYSFPQQPFDCVYILTAAAGISALTLDATAVATTVGTPIFVAANHTLIATWAGAAPTFECCPV